MTQRKPLISIIVPCYNSAPWIEEAVESCLKQTYRNIEIILVNDGSEDNTLELIKKFYVNNPSVISYACQENKGECEAVNRGIEISKGDYFVFFEADDILIDDSIETLIKTILEKNVKVAVGDYINFSRKLHNNEASYRSTSFCFPEDSLASLMKNPLHTCATMIIRNPRKWSREFEPDYPYGYFYPLLATGYSVAHAGKAVAYIRQGHNVNRNSIKYGHFNPLVRLKLFTSFKKFLKEKSIFTPLSKAVLDEQITGSIYQAKRQKQKGFGKYFDYLNAKDLRRYYWFAPFGLSGFMYTFGTRAGLEIFYFINRILGRV